MKFFIDTANVEEIKTALSWGLIDGVTTNPTLISKTKRPFLDVVKDIFSLGEEKDFPISLEVIGMKNGKLDSETMVKEALFFVDFLKKNDLNVNNLVVKIPMSLEGLKAVKILSEKGIKTNVTLVFSPNQALLAMKAGATFISPFVGRLDDIGHDGMRLVEEIVNIIENYGFESEVIVSSVRHPKHVLEAALIGAHIATIPFGVLEKLSKHPLTDIGLERFLKDWENVPDKDELFK